MLFAPSQVIYFLPFPSFYSAFPITVAAGLCVPFPLVTASRGSAPPSLLFHRHIFPCTHDLAKGSQSAPCHPEEVWFFKTVEQFPARIARFFWLFWEVKKCFGREFNFALITQGLLYRALSCVNVELELSYRS